MAPKDLKALQDALGYGFKDENLLRQALTHKSYLNEAPSPAGDNERLEFLGDAVLDLVISEHLLRNYPETAEGRLSKMRARVVSEAGLSRVARRLELGRYLLLGRGEERSRGRAKSSLLANALEAILAAIYLEGGLEAVTRTVTAIFREDLEALLDEAASADYKTALQELCQRDFEELPAYRVLRESGPDHEKVFEVELSIQGRVWGGGTGRSKKEAEQKAAREVLEKLKEERAGGSH